MRRGNVIASVATAGAITGLLVVGVSIVRAQGPHTGRQPQRNHQPSPAPAASGGLAADFLARKERWAVKTGADSEAGGISLQATPKKVADLIRITPPTTRVDAPLFKAKRINQTEKTVFVVDADIIRWKLEDDDHDFHIVIRDHGDANADDPSVGAEGHRRTMIVEVPDPEVVVDRSPWKSQIRATRTATRSKLNPQPAFQRQVVHARITGAGFFDFDHGQSGRAPNIVELHPVLKVEFLP